MAKNQIFKFISSVLAVLLLYITGVYVYGEYIWDKKNKENFTNFHYKIGFYGHGLTRFNDVDTLENIDLLFLGSSLSYREYDPRIFSKNYSKSFNLGSSSQSHIQTKMLLNRYLDKLSPKTVIYEVSPSILNIDGVESAFDVLSNDFNDWNSIKMACEINHMAVYNCLIFNFLKDIDGGKKSYKEKRVMGSNTYVDGGFVERVVTKIEAPKKQGKAWRDWQMRDDQLAALQHNVKLLVNTGCRVILVWNPMPNYRYKSFRNNSELDSIMISTGVEYHNLNSLPNIIDSLHFYDQTHLNQDGVEIMNKHLLELIK